jgi:ATPase family associated with various cellular activities (AAA)
MPDSGLEGTEVEHRSTEVDARVGAPKLVVTDELYLTELAKTRYAALVLERGIPHTAEHRWATNAESIDQLLPFAIVTGQTDRLKSAVLELGPVLGEDCLVLVTLEHGLVYAELAAPEQRVLRDAETWLRQAMPAVEPTAERVIPVSFWSRGSRPIVRRIAVPSWSEIRGNYPRSVSDQLSPLMTASSDLAERGRLLLWHGEPGTGKTYTVRALGWEWREWCRLHYVTDPEVFFGERSRYMLDVLIDEEDEDDEERWRLVVLEDTGELVAADAKEQTGQGLSRLLNVVDGILGQGLRVMILMTTNEEVRRLHPAVVRPGRCAARVRFRPFTRHEAVEWLENRGEARPTSERVTLADLYAGPDREEEPVAVPIGFSRSG